MDSDARINYETIVAEYWQSLTTTLRGFRPAAEYLDTWVPDEDNVKSILNLVEAAQIAGNEKISVYIGPDTLRSLEISRLQELAAQLGKVRVAAEGEGVVFEVSHI